MQAPQATITQAKILTMLDMQNKMNQKVHPQWIEQNYAWYRAVWIECAELMDHQGYKWWKKQVPEVEQVKLEIIDIWHFGMSALFTPAIDINALSQVIAADIEQFKPSASSIHEATEALASHSLASQSFSVPLFCQLMASAQIDFDSLYVSYVSKNVLNFFRQDNGYKDGTYIKQWQGREDNEHLVELSKSLDSASQTFRDDLYKALDRRYAEVSV